MEEKIIGWIKNHMTLVRVFWATIVVGIVCHGHMLFNKLPNCDDVVALTNRGTTFAAGRWLLEYTNILTGKFSIPLFIGLCSIIYIALSGILVSRVLQIKSPLMMLMTGAIMVCFPTVAGTFTFMFTADAYFLALFLAVAAVYLSTLDTANKGVLAIAGGVLVPVIFLALSLGIYQAYIQVAAVLAVLYLMQVLEQESIRKFWNRVLRFVIIFAGGLLLYAVINAAFLRIKNIGYNGHRSGSIENLKDFVENFSSAFLMSYKNVIGMALRDIYGVSTGRIMNGCWLLIMGLLGVIFLWKVLRRKKNIFLAILLLAMIPLAVNLIRFAMFGREMDTLIIYSYCMIPIGLISQVETADLKTLHGAKGRLIRDVVILIGLLIVYRYIIQNNRNYVVNDMAKTEAISYYTSMIAQVKGLDGYSPSLPVYLLGNPKEDTTMPLFSSNAYKGNVRGVTSLNGYVTMYSRQAFISSYCGFSPQWYDDKDEQLKDSAQVQQMPCYPTDGSIQIVDGVVVVKLGK